MSFGGSPCRKSSPTGYRGGTAPATFHRLPYGNAPPMSEDNSAKIMTEQLRAPPVLSTPDTHIFEDPTPLITALRSQRLTDKEIQDVYEVQRTVEEIRAGRWQRIALQFPDEMLHDAPRVFESLQTALSRLREQEAQSNANIERPEAATVASIEDVVNELHEVDIAKQEASHRSNSRRRLFILADTSYGACCVDEIAAEHVEADVVVHYGRSCLSPTARLPVIYVFTSRPLPLEPVIAAFEETFSHRDAKVVVTADITYSDYVLTLYEKLKARGYSNIFAPSIIHDPSSAIPNRTIPPSVTASEEELKEYSLFHISDPPASLLLTLSSRLKSMYIYPTTGPISATPTVLQVQTSQQLRRRYALLTSLTTCSIFGILINTLSVKNYLHTITKIQAQLAAAGKKSYTFVVGKVNAAKVANFSEIGGWIVVGCWESSLIESADFYKPIITPFELQLALMSDEERVWTGEWTGDFSSIVDCEIPKKSADRRDENSQGDDGDISDEEDSAPPEFDLRTGRYVSHSRPMRTPRAGLPSSRELSISNALTKRANGDLATINGTLSPGAEYLRSQRTWQGLGSDFEIAYEEESGATVEQGRSGVARGYRVREDEERR
jgi:diphthamide biosynthesis protein 2